MKKMLCILLAMMMIVGLVPALAEETPVAPPFANGDITLSLLSFDSWLSTASYADNLPVWEAFEKITGVNIDFQVMPYSESEAVIQTRLASGTNLPDITAVPSWSTTAGVTQYGSEGVLLKLDEYMEAGYMPHTVKFLEENPSIAAQMRSPDGSYYAVANCIAEVNTVIPRSIVVRESWLKKAGFESIDDLVTIEDWEKFMRAVKTGDYNGNGKNDEIPLICGDLGQLLYFATGFGFEIAPDYQSNFFTADKDGKVFFTISDPRMKECIQWLHDIYEEGLLYTTINTDSDSIWSLYSQNLVGAYTNIAVDYITRCDGLLADTVEDYKHVMTLPPSVSKDNLCVIAQRPDVEFRYAITTACEYPEIACMWLDYVYASAEGNLLKDFGLEGLSYTVDAEGKPHYTDYVINNDQNLSMHDMMRTLGGAPSFLVMDTLASWQEKQEGTSVWSEGVRLSDRLVPPFPAMVLTMEENELISSGFADFQTYYTEMLTKFVIGTEPLENWDKFVSTLEANGLNEFTAVYQAQYDRYQEFVK